MTSKYTYYNGATWKVSSELYRVGGRTLVQIMTMAWQGRQFTIRNATNPKFQVREVTK